MDFLRKLGLVFIALFLGMTGITAARSRECPSLAAVAVAVALKAALAAAVEMVK
jgi:uncharacterized membrane protein